VTDQPLRAILDTSAILRFVRGGDWSIGVGEILAEIAEENAVAGLPVVCLAEAWRVAVDDSIGLFQLLVERDAAVLMDGPLDWRAVAAATDLTGRLDAAVAAELANDHGVVLLSSTPGLYAGFTNPEFVIEV
jgi:hypothetical protein